MKRPSNPPVAAPISITLIALTMIALSLACGYSSKPTAPAVAGTMPVIAELAPASVNSGQPDFLLAVNGSDFAAKAAINWNAAALPTTYVNATQLTAIVPASSIATSATVMITVTNPAIAGSGAYGSGGTLAETSLPATFAVH
jgi:hypothetical protein